MYLKDSNLFPLSEFRGTAYFCCPQLPLLNIDMVGGVNQTNVASRRDTELRRILNEGVEVKADDVLER